MSSTTKKLLTLVVALVMACTLLAGCGEPVYSDVDLADAKVHESFTSVYDMIGSKVTIDMVTEDPETGLAKVTFEGKEYELGMDFLSMAMVYNCTVPEGSTKYATMDDVYNEWWKLYIQRWNSNVYEVPLYSNQYFDLYNAKIENFVTSPYWGPENAIIAASVKEGEDNSVILGSSTELSGAFRSSSWGKSSPGAADQDIEQLTSGHATMYSDEAGAYIWNMKALAEVPSYVFNEDGTLTYTIKIKNDLVYSDGSAITAKDYLAGPLCNSSPVGVAAGGTGNSLQNFVGFEDFKAYDGTGDKVYFAGMKLLDDYTFSVTIKADYANYYYASTYAAFSPNPLALFLGDGEVVTDENGCVGLSDSFYAKTTKNGTETYVNADVINNNLKWNSKLPYSGPYVVANWDASNLIATLKLNPNYTGDDARGVPSIETITYVKVISETQMDQFLTGQVDVIAGITGGNDTKAALKSVEEHPDKYAETHYDRAGYGKMGFRCDLGPTNFASVRRAIIHTINRPEFAQTFTGGYGAVVHGPYYPKSAAYLACADTIILNQYAYSADSAIAELEADGWVYNKEGKKFKAGTDDVRYRKLTGYDLSPQNILYSTTDGAYKTLKINGEYYMPLAVNWYGTQPNTVTDQLLTAWQTNPNATTDIGMYITYTSCDFTTGLYGELFQMSDYGWDGVAKCCAINFATGFNSAIYDFAYNWSINPDYYDDYSTAYTMDEADFWENY